MATAINATSGWEETPHDTGAGNPARACGSAFGYGSRRRFLRMSSAACGLGLGLGLGWSADRRASAFPVAAGNAGAAPRSVILILMVGGPSQLDTWDPKPDAPEFIRGASESIATRIPGVRISAGLPELARRSHRFQLIRTLTHDATPIHEAGLQLLQTGQLMQHAEDAPHLGSRVFADRVRRKGEPQVAPFVLLPGSLGLTGVALPQGQTAGPLGRGFDPAIPSTLLRPISRRHQERYGAGRFGLACQHAVNRVRAGASMAVVNMCETVFDQVSWDAHGNRPFSGLDAYRQTLLPDLDRGLSALLDELAAEGLDQSTLVVATGEMGRQPHLNRAGGRDHWTRAWSALVSGGPFAPGTVHGRTDAYAGEIADAPFPLVNLHAAMRDWLGRDSTLA